MPEFFAILCARANSERIPGKNLMFLNGRPLIQYTIDAARNSELFQHIVVNSDSDAILEQAAALGAEIYNRPKELGKSNIFVLDVINEWIRSAEINKKARIAILFPTVPLRSSEDIKEAYTIFEKNRFEMPVVSVTSYEYPVQVALCLREGRLHPYFKEEYGRSTRHNDHETLYRANYGVIWNTAGKLLEQKKLIGVHPIPYIMPYERGVDIDEPFQLLLAELLIKHQEEN